MKLVLPYPVSANRYWRHIAHPSTKRPITLLSREAKAYRDECGWRAREAGVKNPLAGCVQLHIRLVPKNGVCMDLDNALKVVIDALKGIVYCDDAQVYRIDAHRAEPDTRGARLEVEIHPYNMPLALGDVPRPGAMRWRATLEAMQRDMDAIADGFEPRELCPHLQAMGRSMERKAA